MALWGFLKLSLKDLFTRPFSKQSERLVAGGLTTFFFFYSAMVSNHQD